MKNFHQLKLKRNARVFIPLCGKTVDRKWLLDNEYRVVSIELNENIEIFVGNIFNLNKSILGKVDAIFDRGAIVALPTLMRKEYTSLLIYI